MLLTVSEVLKNAEKDRTKKGAFVFAKRFLCETCSGINIAVTACVLEHQIDRYLEVQIKQGEKTSFRVYFRCMF